VQQPRRPSERLAMTLRSWSWSWSWSLSPLAEATVADVVSVADAVSGRRLGMAAAKRIACHLHIEVVFLRAVDRVVDEGVGRVVPTIVTAAITVVVVGTLCSIVHETTHVHHVDLCPTAVSRAPRHTVSADGDDRR
jgi:hypothetical protein